MNHVKKQTNITYIFASEKFEVQFKTELGATLLTVCNS